MKMGKRLYLIVLLEVDETDFKNHPLIKDMSERGSIFSFQNYFPQEPKTALTHILTGCNPGKAGFMDIDINPLRIKESKGYERMFLSQLQKKGVPVNFYMNEIPSEQSGVSCIYLDNFHLLEGFYEIEQTDDIYIFLVAPFFRKYSDKAVNINNFLQEMEILERDDRGEIDWENSLAYQKEYGQIWLNVIGREAKGVVSPGDEYHEVREALIKGLRGKLKDRENGQLVVEHVFKKEELFYGERLSNMPDIILALREGYGFSSVSGEPVFDTASVFKKTTRAYTSGRGVCLGKNIRSNNNIGEVNIASIAPTIFYCLENTIPAAIDGEVELRFFTEEVVSACLPSYDSEELSSELSKEDEDLIIKRLKGLGYME